MSSFLQGSMIVRPGGSLSATLLPSAVDRSVPLLEAGLRLKKPWRLALVSHTT
jgi:hypothetical protein